MREVKYDWMAQWVPDWIKHLEEFFCDTLPFDEYKSFAQRLVASLVIGVDLDPVKHKFLIYILEEDQKITNNLVSNENQKESLLDLMTSCVLAHEAILDGKHDQVIWDKTRDKVRWLLSKIPTPITTFHPPTTYLLANSVSSAMSSMPHRTALAMEHSVIASDDTSQYSKHAEKLLSMLAEVK